MSDFILTGHTTVTTLHVTAEQAAIYSLEGLADAGGVHVDMVRHYCELGLLGKVSEEAASGQTFDDAALYDLRRIEFLRKEHGVNLQALPLVFDLIREVEKLREEVKFLRGL